MPYPWPSFGSMFLFKREETAVFGTDVGWVRSPHYTVQTPLGSERDTITTLALGSMTRTFEVYVSPERYAILELLVNTKFLFTDWRRPVPESRMVFFSSLEPLDKDLIRAKHRASATSRAIRARISLLSQ